MILLITNKEDVTVDYVVCELQRRELSYYRLNTEEIPENVYIDFDFTSDTFLLYDTVKNYVLDLACITSVYFRRPHLTSLSHIESKINITERTYLQREAAPILEGIYKILDRKY